MLERVEGHSSRLPSSVVAKSICHNTVRGFVKGHGQDNRYNPGAHLIGCHRFALSYFSLARKERVELRLDFFSTEIIRRGTAAPRFAAPEPCRREWRNRPSRRDNLLHLAGVSIAVEGKIAAGGERLPR